MSTPWLDDLNPAQREAVTYGDGPLRVIAGAGSGKTRTLACRVAHLIDRGVPPDRILLLTFTRRAAAEMLGRADRMVGREVTGKVWGGTFHAVANRLLRIYGRAIGLAPEFTVMDQADAADVMNVIRNELGLAKAKRRFPRKVTLVHIYSRVVNAQDPLSDVLDRYFPWCQDDKEDIAAVFDRYTERKRQANVLDYDDLLLYWNVLASAPGVGDTVADRFDHILVDEYQDTNTIQAQLLAAMRRHRPNLMVVGDDAQSIYSFRAATIRNILDFPEQFPNTHTVTLEQNYRSTLPILDASNAVMSPAKERHTKNLWSDRESDQRPILVTCLEESQQSSLVVENVLAHLEEGIPLQRQAVLFRAGHHSDHLEVELSRRNIPFHKYGGLKFIEAAHVKDMLALLRILENPADEISWFRVLQLLDGIGPASARRVIDALAASPAESDADGEVKSRLGRLFESPPKVPAAATKQFDALRATLAACEGVKVRKKGGAGQARGEKPPLAVQIERIRRFYEPIFKRIYENPVMRLRDLEQLSHIAEGYRSRSRFISDLTLDPPTSTADLAQPPFLEEDWLVLSTIHSAKGCEWDVVHVIHAADGMIPSDMAVTDEAGVEEERRLFYVAMTRARDWLYLYFPLRYYHRKMRFSDAHSYAQLTRFITPEVRSLLEERSGQRPMEEDVPRGPNGTGELDAWLKKLWKA